MARAEPGHFIFLDAPPQDVRAKRGQSPLQSLVRMLSFTATKKGSAAAALYLFEPPPLAESPSEARTIPSTIPC